MRLIDYLKQQGITALFTSLTSDVAADVADSQVGVSSLMDTWILLSNLAANGERTRTLQVLKSRGMPHSHQVREFVMGDHGVDLVDVYLSGDRVLTGTARISQVAQEAAADELRRRDHERRVQGAGEPSQGDRRADRGAERAGRGACRRGEFAIERERLAAEGAVGAVARQRAVARRAAAAATRRAARRARGPK